MCNATFLYMHQRKETQHAHLHPIYTSIYTYRATLFINRPQHTGYTFDEREALLYYSSRPPYENGAPRADNAQSGDRVSHALAARSSYSFYMRASVAKNTEQLFINEIKRGEWLSCPRNSFINLVLILVSIYTYVCVCV